MNKDCIVAFSWSILIRQSRASAFRLSFSLSSRFLSVKSPSTADSSSSMLAFANDTGSCFSRTMLFTSRGLCGESVSAGLGITSF